MLYFKRVLVDEMSIVHAPCIHINVIYTCICKKAFFAEGLFVLNNEKAVLIRYHHEKERKKKLCYI